ncbi:MAG: dihydropteridine reductase [Eubacterium sp.]|nr:dihydropteridine reductase [Eubacterium sp.]
MNTDKIYAESIAKEYAPKETSKVVALRKLDAKAKRPANIFAFTFGTISALILGVGMCLCMGQFDLNSTISMVFGIIVGIIGIIGVSINYPIYKKLLKKGKDKYAFEIVELAKEISETN